MKKICILTVLMCFLAGNVFASTQTVPATVSCRTEGLSYADTNRHDSSKLTVRAEVNGHKSWIRFNGLQAYYLPGLRAATLTVTLIVNNTGAQSFNVSAVNDNYLTNRDWAETAITWNNAPGNDTTSLGALNPTQTTLLSTVNFSDGTIGQTFSINVFPAIQADTDGIVQFVLHNGSSLLNFATWDHATPAYRPYLTLEYKPAGADYPNPAIGATTTASLPALSWTLPDPNIPGTPIWCDVYLGTDPNRPQMDKKTLANGVTSVAINTANFPRFGTLSDKTQYYWFVDCHDSSRLPNPVPSETWSFFTDNNVAPVVNAGPDQITWGLPKVVAMNPVVTDDGLPIPPALTYTWTQTAGPASAVINSPSVANTPITITERGDYQFRLTVSDGDKQGTDTLQVVVGINACDASHIDTGAVYDTGDKNQDCLVDMKDFAIIASNWLNCTDILTNCGH